MENPPKEIQPDLFFEQDPRLEELYERAKLNIAILGGDRGTEEAEELGYGLTKGWFSVATGGYETGTMGRALKGADRAIAELQKDDPEAVKHILPIARGITVDKLNRKNIPTAEGPHITQEVREDEHALYERLARLTQDSSIAIVLAGDRGTEVEVGALMHFEENIPGKLGDIQKPVIFVGHYFENFLRERYSGLLKNNSSIFMVETTAEAKKLVENLFQKTQIQKKSGGDPEKVREIETFIESKLMKTLFSL